MRIIGFDRDSATDAQKDRIDRLIVGDMAYTNRIYTIYFN
jgi:hypothetical protein